MNRPRLRTLLLLLLLLPLFAVGAPPGWVIGWGDNNVGRATGVANGLYTNGLVTVNGEALTDIVAISAGISHSLALKKDGTVVAWGSNRYGETTVPVGLSNVVAVSAVYFSMALKEDGTVVSWGAYNPTSLPTGLSNVVALAAGGADCVLALNSDGRVIGWGQSGVPESWTNIIVIDCAKDRYGDNLALTSNGTVLAWGPYANSSLGLSNIVAISAGGTHCLALNRDGTVVEWSTRDNKPKAVPGLSNIVAIAATGSDTGLALKNDGTVVFLGYYPYHRMDVPAGLSNVVAIAGGGGFCLAITTNRAVADKFLQK
jgi:alpha-tubulin suppressor-like RCC1 family protein